MWELRRAVLGAVIGSGALLAVSGLSGGLGAALHHLGDEVGARAALGVAGVAAASFVLLHILLVTLLALAFLQRNMEGRPDTKTASGPLGWLSSCHAN